MWRHRSGPESSPGSGFQRMHIHMFGELQFYKPSFANGIRYDDPFFDFKWPKKPKVISKKDLSFKNFKK